ncbi:MAG: TOMM precursor leader peptide-binding protein [Acidobacteriota bacterium]
MIQRPRLKRYLTVYPLSSDTWALRGGAEELWRVRLNQGAARNLGLLLSYLDGRHEREALLEKLAGDGGDPEIASRLLDHLEAGSFLEDAAADTLPPAQAERFHDQIVFFSRFSQIGGVQAQRLLTESRVGVVGDGRLARSIVRGLRESGVGEIVVSTSSDRGVDFVGEGVSRVALDRSTIWPEDAHCDVPDWWILAEEAHDPDLPAAFDKFAHRQGVPWLLVRLLEAHEGWVGPLFVPGDTASFASLEARLRGNLHHYDEYEALNSFLSERGTAANPVGGLHASHDVLAAIAVSELVKLITGTLAPHLAGRFVTLSFLTWETQIHEVMRVPHLEPRSRERPVLFPWKEASFGDPEKARFG